MPMTKMYHSISGQIVGDTINSQTRSYLGDGFGNVVGTTNPDSTLQMWFVYRPYGSTASVTGTGVEPVVRWGGSRRMLVVDESNAEYGDARGGSYSVGEGQLTNGNYGEYELPGFPRDWNPLKRGEMPRITPMPPYKKPPRKNPPPVEVNPPLPPTPPLKRLLPGDNEDKLLAPWVRLLTCVACCTVKTMGGGPFMAYIQPILDAIRMPELDCTETGDYEIGKGESIPKIGNMEDLLKWVCKKNGIPPEACNMERIPGLDDEWLPEVVKDIIEKANKAISKCNSVTCFVECGLEFNAGMEKAKHPDPWQNCGLENDEDACIACCDKSFGSRSNPARQTCEYQCSDHY